MKQTITIGILVLAAISIIVFGGKSPIKFGEVSLSSVATNSSSTIGSAAIITVLSESNGAVKRACTNTGNVVAYLSFNSTSTGFVAATGRALTVSSTFILDDVNEKLWTGTIFARTINGTTTISCSQQ